MKKIISLILIAITTVLLPSCKDLKSKNQFQIGNQTHYVSEAYIIDYETEANGCYKLGLLLYGYSSMTSNILISFALYSPTAGDFQDGEYVYSSRDKKFGFNESSWNMLTGNPINIESGTVNVEHIDGYEYRFTVNCMDEFDYAVTGTFEGALFEQALE